MKLTTILLFTLLSISHVIAEIPFPTARSGNYSFRAETRLSNGLKTDRDAGRLNVQLSPSGRTQISLFGRDSQSRQTFRANHVFIYFSKTLGEDRNITRFRVRWMKNRGNSGIKVEGSDRNSRSEINGNFGLSSNLVLFSFKVDGGRRFYIARQK